MPRRSPSQRTATEAQRVRALQREAEVGAAAASRELGIPASTIRAWKARAKPPAEKAAKPEQSAVSPPPVTEDIEWLEEELGRTRKLARIASSAWSRQLQAGKSTGRHATDYGIYLDKCGMLEARIQAAKAARALISQGQAAVLAERFRRFVAVIGVPHEDSEVKAVMRAVLVGDEPTADEAERARAAVRQVFAAQIEAELRDRLRAETERAPRQLEPGPPLPPRHPDGERAERFDTSHDHPVRGGATGAMQTRANHATAGAGEEVVDGEVVHDFTVPYEQIDPDNLDPEAERAWESLRERHRVQPALAEHEFKRWWTDRARRYRDHTAVAAPWRPSAHRLDGNRFNHPGLR